MKVLAMLVALASLLFVGVTTTQTAQAAPHKKPSVTSKTVTGTIAGSTDQVTGNYKITKFAVEKGKLVAKGTFTGNIVGGDPDDTIKKKVTVPVSKAPAAPAAAAQAQDVESLATCQILNLLLGPLDLNVLGLRVQLNQVDLDITGVPGAGNLLGNLLCGVAGLLDAPSLPALNDIIADLLNLILGNLN